MFYNALPAKIGSKGKKVLDVIPAVQPDIDEEEVKSDRRLLDADVDIDKHHDKSPNKRRSRTESSTIPFAGATPDQQWMWEMSQLGR